MVKVLFKETLPEGEEKNEEGIPEVLSRIGLIFSEEIRQKVVSVFIVRIREGLKGPSSYMRSRTDEEVIRRKPYGGQETTKVQVCIIAVPVEEGRGGHAAEDGNLIDKVLDVVIISFTYETRQGRSLTTV